MALSIQSEDSMPSEDNQFQRVKAHMAGLFTDRSELSEDSVVPVVGLFQMSLRHDIQTMEDARAVGVNLIDGQTQILNLELVAPEITARIIDFLDGVAFALEGSVECISGAIYLVTPGGVIVNKQQAP